MENSCGYFQNLLQNGISLDDTLLLDIPTTSQVSPSIELDSSIQQVDNEIESSSDEFSEDLEEEESDDDLDGVTDLEPDGGLASVESVVQVEKTEHVQGEFINNPLSFTVDKSWLSAYEVADFSSERQFVTQGPTNPNGTWKDFIFSDKKSLLRALEQFYSTGCANEEVDFKRLKEQLKIECEDAWQWVEDHIIDDREYWALAFDGGRRYGVMTTNWSESLNSVLRGTRSLPITAFIAATFYRVNQAFVERSEEGRKMTTQLCPKVLGKIRPRQLVSRGYQVCRYGPCEYAVNTGTTTYTVTINGRFSACECQTFRLTGLPCSHMLASCGDIWHGTDFHTLCDDWYFAESYRTAYSIQFHPVPDKRFWPNHEGPAILPPALRKKKGRPKSTRIHNSMDARETIGRAKRKCQHCNVAGHYKKKCPQLKNSNQAQQVRGTYN